MKMVKSLLLGSAAGLVAVAGAQAADLPVKAKPVQYVKICTLYGEGFYYIPGSDTCIKIGGLIRADYGWNVGGARTPAYSGTQGAADRTVATYSTRHRANVQMDTRTQTQYGTLRTQTSLHFQNENGSESFNAARAFIQWAGFTFGRMQSYQDTWAISDSWHFAQQQNNNDNGANGINSIAYTWELGNGMTLTLGADEKKTKSLTNLSRTDALKIGVEPVSSYAGQRWPDPYVNFKVDQAWGYWSTTFQVHDVQATYYNESPVIAPVCQNGVQPGQPQGAVLSNCGSPGDKIGWAINTGAEFKLPMIAPNDRFGFNFRYSQGAGQFGGGGNTATAGLFGGGNNLAYGMMTDGVFLNGGPIFLTTHWTVGAGFEHNWTPELKTSFTGSYTRTLYGGGAKAIIATNVCAAGSQVGFSQVGGLTNCNPDWGFFQGGVRTLWAPVRGFYLGVDVGYTQVWTAFGGSTPTVVSTNTGATSGTVNQINNIIGARPAGVYTFNNQGSMYAIFRAQRSFNSAGD